MTPQQINLVQETFADVKPIAATAAELFYNRLFTLDPALRPLSDLMQLGALEEAVVAA